MTTVLFCALALLVGTPTASARTLERLSPVVNLRHAISWHRVETWRYQDRAAIPRTPTRYAERRTRSLLFLSWIDRVWSRRQVAARHLAARHSAIAHLTLWNCIHRGEGDGWNPTHTYSGPLQMTSGWAGYPVSDWNTVPLAVVYADAETQFRAHGYSTAWLEGQWPHTSPPCLAYA